MPIVAEHQSSVGEGVLSGRQKLIFVPLCIGIALLVYNQRIGWTDVSGPSWSAFVLRSDVWFAVSVTLGCLISPRDTLMVRGNFRVVRKILFWFPLWFLMGFLIGTEFSKAVYDANPDLFGIGDFARGILAGCIGIMVFNISNANKFAKDAFINMLIWSPLLNVVVGGLIFVGRLDAESFDPSGSGRFQGLASNPNMIMTQNCIALGFLIPKILSLSSAAFLKRTIFTSYSLILVAIMIWTGVRAALVVLPFVFIVFLWLRLKPTFRSVRNTCVSILQISLLFFLVAVISNYMGISGVLVDRVAEEDGRLFLWKLYSGMLVSNPLGMGMAFETVADTTSIVEGQRLPPHNALLLAGMYSGLIGIVSSMMVLIWVAGVIRRLKRFVDWGARNVEMEVYGSILGWVSLVGVLMFGGNLFGDFYFSILTALLLVVFVTVTRPNRIGVQNQ